MIPDEESWLSFLSQSTHQSVTFSKSVIVCSNNVIRAFKASVKLILENGFEKTVSHVGLLFNKNWYWLCSKQYDLSKILDLTKFDELFEMFFIVFQWMKKYE